MLKVSPRDSAKLRRGDGKVLRQASHISGCLYHCLVQACGVRRAQLTERKPHWKKPKMGPESLTLPEKSPVMEAPRQTSDNRQSLLPACPLAAPGGLEME